jgi:hypothetical protein
MDPTQTECTFSLFSTTHTHTHIKSNWYRREGSVNVNRNKKQNKINTHTHTHTYIDWFECFDEFSLAQPFQSLVENGLMQTTTSTQLLRPNALHSSLYINIYTFVTHTLHIHTYTHKHIRAYIET